MDEKLLSRCQVEYLGGKSLTKLGEEHAVNRKQLSRELKKSGVIITKKGRPANVTRKYSLNNYNIILQ